MRTQYLKLKEVEIEFGSAGLNRRYMLNLIDRGLIPAIKHDSKSKGYRIKREDIIKYLDRRKINKGA